MLTFDDCIRCGAGIVTALLLATGCAWAADSAKLEDLDRRIAYWKGGAPDSDERLPYCEFDGGAKFPSKYYETDNRDGVTGKCNDGDSVLFNGLLCSSGDPRGCDAVRRSQGEDGRWWRSPRNKLLMPDENSETTFSNDHAGGVLLYVLEQRDGAAFERWLNWIGSNQRYIGVVPRYCTDDRCAFKPSDCPMLDRAAVALGKGNPVCDIAPGPSEVLKAIEDLHKSIRDAFEAIPGHGALAPGFKPLNDIVVRLIGELRKVIDSAEVERKKIATLLRVTSNQAELITIINSLVNDAGYPRHGVAVNAYILLKYGGLNTPQVLAAAEILANKEPKNPFFEFVAHGSTDRMLDLILEQCPSSTSDKPHPRFQWAWERKDSEKAFLNTVYWDCLFVANLYKGGSIKGINLPIPQDFSVAYFTLNADRIALEANISDKLSQLQAIVDVLHGRSIDKVVERKIEQMVEKIKDRIKHPEKNIPFSKLPELPKKPQDVFEFLTSPF